MLLDTENYTYEKKIIVPTIFFLKRYLICFAFMLCIPYFFLSSMFYSLAFILEPLNPILFGVVLSIPTIVHFLNMYSYINTKRIALKGNDLILIYKDKEYLDLSITHDQNVIQIKSLSNKVFEVIFIKNENEEICEWIFRNINAETTKISGSLLLQHLMMLIYYIPYHITFIIIVVITLSLLL